ncbi:GlxA family transcriptional regulator [Amnibacterium kyonggiense]|uniref:AraC family transcriptional regulator with amidase-like domain n=1 Tax=Amnibacterium kyonggiense TaxID=595671 RepID=A0A4R7FSP9_9MICO|nr:helix-turn-helix domain-containing protein [Amnibacterium kyonggiense]TDS80788.1 AraC family transcriptional regulator with amidase-like domain [Amnibacterium kyonggiense]
MPSDRPHRVVVLAQDGAYPFELGIPARVFGATDGLYEVLLCTPTGGPIETNAGFAVTPSTGSEVLATADTVIVAPVDPWRLRPELSAETAAALDLVRSDARLVSICTGGFTLAAAGRLAGRTAATHWQCAPLFRSWFPDIELDEHVLFTGDATVMTSAGAASGIDLCLHLIRVDHGVEVATTAARRCVVAPHREGGQAQFIERPVPDAPDLSTSPTREWALARLAEPLTIERMAQHAHMSARTFVRRFRADTGLAPGQWVTQQRLAAARSLLETTDLPIDEVATAVGYATATSLRRHLAARLGTSPSSYRTAYRGREDVLAGV